MPRLLSVDLRYGSDVTIRFTTSRAVFDACDTAVLQLVDPGPRHCELTVRIERGGVAEAALWNPDRLRRESLPIENVTVRGTTVECCVPLALLPIPRTTPDVAAALIVNGALVQSGFPVSVRPGILAPIASRV
jgi:hypothetical protein